MGSGFESQGAHFKENPADSSESAGFLGSLVNTVFGLEELGLGFVFDGARRMFPSRLRRGTRHPDAPLFLASLRRASGLTP